jgi:hypothetical protein
MLTSTALPEQLRKEIAAARQHLILLEQAAAKLTSPPADTDPEVDWLDGGSEIAAFLGWPVKRVYAVYKTGHFGNAVWKTGWRSMAGSKSRLRALPERLTTKTP